MSEVLDQLDDAPLARWRARPAEFIETVLYNPETGQAVRVARCRA